MKDGRRQSNAYLLQRIAAAHNLLANPTATDAQRRGARCRLNWTLTVMRGLTPVPAMKRPLEIDRLAKKVSARVSVAG